MADTFTTSNPKAKVVQYEVLINGSKLPTNYTIESIKTKREIGSIPTANITIKEAKGRPEQDFSAGISAFPGKAGDSLEVKVGTVSTKKTVFKGSVDEVGISVSKSGATFDVTGKDEAESMTRKKRNEYSVPESGIVTDQDMMNTIGGRNGAASVSVKSDMSIEHEHLPQIDSSDWDFLMHRAEYYGHMVTCMDGTVEIEEPRLDSQATYTFGIDIADINLTVSTKGQVDGVEAEAWDPDTQELVKASGSEPGFAIHSSKVRGEVIGPASWSGDENILKLKHMGPLPESDLKKWADGTLKRIRLGAVTGTITVDGNYDLRPNRAITLAGVSSELDGLAFVKGVEHSIVPHNWDTTLSIGYETESFAQNNSGGSVSPPAATGQLPASNSGKQIATVSKIYEDPNKGFRVQVDIKNMGEPDEPIWARIAAPQGSKGTGFYNMPEEGDEVTVSFLNGDPRFPIIDGSIYSKANPMPVDPDAGGDWDGKTKDNNVKGFFSREGLMMRFQETDLIIRIETPAGNVVEMNEKEKHILIEDQNKNKMLMNEKGIEVYTPFDYKLKADGLIKMEAGTTIAVKSGTSSKYEAGTTFDTKAGTANTMKGVKCEVNGSATVIIKGGIVQIN